MAYEDLTPFLGKRENHRVVKRPQFYGNGGRLRANRPIEVFCDVGGGYFYTLPPGVVLPAERHQQMVDFAASLGAPAAKPAAESSKK